MKNSPIADCSFKAQAESLDASPQWGHASSRSSDGIQKERRRNVPEAGERLVGPDRGRSDAAQFIENAQRCSWKRTPEPVGEYRRASPETVDAVRRKQL